MTLPRPDLPIVLLSHHGPVSFGRDESGRTANRGAGGLVTRSSAPLSDLPDAVWVCAPPTRTRCRWRARPPVFSINLEPEPRLLDQAEPRLSGAPGSHRSAAPGRGRPPGPWPAMSRTEPCWGDSCTAWRWDRVAAVIDQLDVRGVLSVPVQSDGRPVGTLDVHATSRGLVGEELMALRRLPPSPPSWSVRARGTGQSGPRDGAAAAGIDQPDLDWRRGQRAAGQPRGHAQREVPAAPARCRRRASWPIWLGRWCSRHNVSGRRLAIDDAGFGWPRPASRPPSRRCKWA